MATKTDKEGRELVEIRYEMGIPGTFAKGPIMGYFLEKLKEKELWGTRCGKCYNVIFPPRVLCPKCMVDMAEWVRMEDYAHIVTFDVVHFPTINPLTGEMRPVPYTSLFIVFPNGAGFFHFCLETDHEKIKPGKKVTPVWADKREGRPADLRGWVLAEE
jgi:hypothetical protein